MPDSDPDVFASDGTINPQWLGFITNKDPAVSEIAAYFLPGDKLNPEAKCCVLECVMPNRTGKFTMPNATEVNPMMLCFFCNRVFHAGCMDLDAHLIREESVPWKCGDCKIDLMNQHCQGFYNQTGYKSSLIIRRTKFLKTGTKESNESFQRDLEFSKADLESFDRRSRQLLIEDDPEVTENPSFITPYVLKRVMQSRADKKRASEVSERFQAELARTQTRLREVEASYVQQQASPSQTTNADQSMTFNVPHSSTFMPNMATDRATTVLSNLYTSGNTSAVIEANQTVVNTTFQDNRDIPNPAIIPVAENNVTDFNDTQATVNPADFTTLLQRLTVSQERDERRNLENLRRRALPKIAEFKGEENKWLAFKQDVDRYRAHLGRDEVSFKYFIKGALKGEAFEIVRDLFEAESLDIIMATLKVAFGDEMRMVRNRGEELKNFKFSANLYRMEAIKLQSSIQAYFAACRYANIGYINTNAIAEALFCQFSHEDRLRCKDYYRQKYPDASTIVMDVQTIYDYLLKRIPLLDDAPPKKKIAEPEQKAKSKPFQTYNVSISTPKYNGNYKFEIKDKSKAPYLGYDLDKVAATKKECLFCNSDEHFPLQCPRFKEKSENDRLKWINDKGICKNCILTTSHQATECDLKSNCGFKVDKTSRCCSRHHISVHEASNNAQRSSRSINYRKRRSNTRNNTSRAARKVNEARNANEPVNDVIIANTGAAFHTIDPKDFKLSYRMNVGAINDVESDTPKTVKVFRVKLWGPKGYIVALAIGDSGSEVTLVRNDLRQALAINGNPHTLHLQWADNTSRTCNTHQFNMQIQSTEENATKYDLNNCFALDDLFLPQRTLNMSNLRKQFPYLLNVPFEGYLDEHPVMLIGAPHAHLIEGCELIEGESNGPIAVRTRIGWSVYGGMTHVNQIKHKANAVNSLTESVDDTEDLFEDPVEEDKKVTNEELHKLLVEHFSVESLGVRATQTQLTENERKAVEILDEEVKITDGGFVEAPLVWNRNNKIIPRLPNNYNAVLRRQLAEERKLMKNPLHHEAFNNNVKDLIAQNFLREANDQDMKGNWPNVWYLPMSLVINENKHPPKMRNVYDASAVYKGTSLNANLLKGPDLLINIITPLIQMRMNKIAFTADVKAMFNMVKICPRDQQCQRVLFRESCDLPMKTYISTVMLFGPTSSPFTSQYVKNKNAEKWIDKYPDAAKTLADFTYMDDVLTSEPTVEKALQVAKQCIEICNAINWKLIAFQSNSRELLESLPPSVVKLDAIPLPETEAESQVAKVLGCQWNTIEDCFQFKLENDLFIKLVNDFDQKPTKRDQASTLARIYDVFGLISHFTIRGRMLLQRSWEDKVGWDETISDKAVKDWKAWLQQIKDVAKLKFPRPFSQLDGLSEADDVHLHIFSDAGGEAFGAVAYLVIKYKDRVESTIVMAKAKVTPLRLKTETVVREMPRLELMAALLAARLSKTITNAMKNVNLRRTFWCDSEVVLRWIINPNQKLIKYAIGPVEELLELTERNEWKYVPTELNVADLCTKMKRFDFSCNDSVWMKGPAFITQNELLWPELPDRLPDDSSMANNIYLEKLKYSTHVLPPINCAMASDDAIDRLSASIKAKWTKLTRATGRALKIHMDIFIPLIRTKQFNNMLIRKELKKLTNGVELVQPVDIERAEHFIFRKIQREAFPVEYKALSEGKSVKNPTMQQLNVFMDPQGLIRINARTNVNKKSHPQQYVPLLPRKNVFVTNLLAYYHYKYEHVCTEAQVAEIRSFAWVLQLRTALRSVKARCNWCRIKNAMPYSPKMAPLPDDRVNADLKPFEVTGIDIMGPLRPTINGNIKKVYILIFVCTLTRYIHLHILDSMESLRILEAMVTFWTAYGPVRKFVSDNASNFKRTAKTLEEDYQREKVFNSHLSVLGPKLSELYRVEWQFIPVHAPWFGGVYERLIKEVKRALFSTLERRKVSRVELNIAVQEAAHRINCRPLTENPIDAADSEILTPHHLVKNKSGWPLLPGIHKNVYTSIPERSIYKRGRATADEMMQKFTSRYLPELTKQSKWHKKETPPRVGDLVLVIEPNQTRREWKRGKIIKVHIGKDGTARVADVRMANGVIKKNRAVRNLAKLNLTNGLHDENLPSTSTASLTVDGNSKVNVNSIFEFHAIPNRIEASYAFIYITGNFLSCSRLENKLTNYKMKRSSSFINNNSMIIQIDGISRNMPLSEIAEILEPDIKSIIGLARVYDYQARVNLDGIFVFLLDREEFAKLLRKHQAAKWKNGVSVTFPNLSIANAYFKPSFETSSEESISRVPKPLALFNLPIMEFNTTGYVAQILKTFEYKTEVKAFRWCIAESRQMTRPFGFLLLPTRQQVMQLSGKSFICCDTVLDAKTSDSATVLIHNIDANLVNYRHKAILTETIVNANLLHRESNEIQRAGISITIFQDSNPVMMKSAATEESTKISSVIVIPKAKRAIVHSPTASTSRTMPDIAEDSVTLTLSDNERFNDEPCCSKSLLPPANKPDGPISLQEHPTVKSNIVNEDSKEKKKKDKVRNSRYIRLRVVGTYKFNTFATKAMCYVKRHKSILFIEGGLGSVAYIEFQDEKDASKFKKVVEGLKEDGTCSVTLSDDSVKRKIEKAKAKTLKPILSDETLYLIDEDMDVIQCRFGSEWGKVTFAPPQNVPV